MHEPVTIPEPTLRESQDRLIAALDDWYESVDPCEQGHVDHGLDAHVGRHLVHTFAGMSGGLHPRIGSRGQGDRDAPSDGARRRGAFPGGPMDRLRDEWRGRAMTAQPRDLLRAVPLDYPAAVQTIAALEDRVREYQAYVDRGADVGFVVIAAQRALLAVRQTFGLWPMTEAQMDAAHEAAHAELDELREAEGLPDVPLALDVYWNRGA